MPEPDRPDGALSTPDVMFLPFCATGEEAWREHARLRWLDPGVVARRLPDVVHQVLNQGESSPTAMLELQTDAEDGPVTWLRLDEAPTREDVFDLMPAGLRVRAIVTGEVAPVEAGLRVEFHVFRAEPGAEDVTERIGGVLHLQDPAPGLLRLSRALARVLDLPFVPPATGLLTSSGDAFLHFLAGLDNAMLLSGDLDIAVPEDREALMRPFADALALDPTFGLALRVANATTALALDGKRLDREAVRRFLDRCYAAHPNDGEACVAVAEQLTGMGDDGRALAWLEHAALLDPPPPRGLENLGILLARRGDLDAAQRLWQRGIEVDGHPDFFSHLAQVAFRTGDDELAFANMARGLWRLRERTVRAAEWNDGDRGRSVILECLQAALSTRQAPAELSAALDGLRGLLLGEDRIHLGLCLHACRRNAEARTELLGGLRAILLDLDVRDRAVRALLQIAVPDFERRFARAVDVAERARDPRKALDELAGWYELQEEFWPALYYAGIAHKRLGDADSALDMFAEALDLFPSEPSVLYEMAELFAARQNCKRALELVDEALGERPRDPRLHAARARYQHGLGRAQDARDTLQRAFAAGLDSPELRRIGKMLHRGRRA